MVNSEKKQNKIFEVMIRTWETYITSHWRPKLCFNFLFFFISGILFSILLLFILNKTKIFKQLNYHHIPENHYLQIRDEFPILSNYLINENQRNDKTKPSDKGKLA